MTHSRQFLGPAEAAKRLGVTTKALRHYEQRGLLVPPRSRAGWRTYGPAEMARAAEIVALRALGLGLVQVERALQGGPRSLEMALADHQGALEGRMRGLAGNLDKVRRLRADLARGAAPDAAWPARPAVPTTQAPIAFELPWPWGGESFELRDIRPITYIVGPLFSGKTRLARRIAEALPNALFLGLDRLAGGAAEARRRLRGDPALKARVDRALRGLAGEGATPSAALRALLVALEAHSAATLVVDMVEDGLDQATQEALVATLRRRGAAARPLFLLTRSRAVLDLAAVGPDEAILLCPANHSPPTHVAPHRGAPGFEAVATCLATPAVRARTRGVVAVRAEVA